MKWQTDNGACTVDPVGYNHLSGKIVLSIKNAPPPLRKKYRNLTKIKTPANLHIYLSYLQFMVQWLINHDGHANENS